MLAADPPNFPFRSWWLEAVGSPSTRYVLVFDGGELIGGLPIDLQHTYFRRPIVAVIHTAGINPYRAAHADILALPGAEGEVVAQVAKWLRSYRHGIAMLHTVKGTGRMQAVLPVPSTVKEATRAAYVRVPPTFEEYLSQRSRNFRREVRRHERRLEAAGYTYQKLGKDDVERGLAELKRLHQLRIGEESDFTPRYHIFERIARAAAQAGELTFHAMARDDHVVAIDAVFEADGHAEDFQSGLDTRDKELRGAGTVLLTKIIEDCCERGVRELDLSYPASDYKLRFTDTSRPVLDLHATWGWAPTWIPRARRLLGAPTRLRAVFNHRRPPREMTPP